MGNELRPCPFCGGKPVHTDRYRTPEGEAAETVECGSCLASVYEWGDETAAEAWNLRDGDALRAELAAERERAERAERERDKLIASWPVFGADPPPRRIQYFGIGRLWKVWTEGIVADAVHVADRTAAVRMAAHLDAPAAPPAKATPGEGEG